MTNRRRSHPIPAGALACRAGALLIFALVSTGCLGRFHAARADREVYPIIADKQIEALGESQDFTLENEDDPLTERVHTGAPVVNDPLSTSGLTISLSEALGLALNNNRNYRTRQEELYLSALDLTDARHEFSPIFTAAVTGRATRQANTTVDLFGQEQLAVERFGTVATDFAVTKLFATGARVTVAYTQDFFRFWTQPKAQGESSALALSIVQPLLRGGGFNVTLENLRQAERNVIYAVREFERFRRQFMVDRINDYYRLLQSADQIENERASYRRLQVARERAELLEQAERLAPFQVDQARQDELSARNRWILAITDYASLIDRFKLDLGLPPELAIQPDPNELAELEQRGVVELDYDPQTAMERALGRRLDLRTALDRVEDAERLRKVAWNSLLPVLDARFDYTVPDAGSDDVFDMDWRLREYSGQVDFSLPLDRKTERNAYRQSLISLERVSRAAQLLRDEIVAQVRSSIQDVGEARETYEIQLEGLRLAEKRVDSVNLLIEAGREGVEIRDQLEAESALRNARNNVTQALVEYTLARLRFYQAIEALYVDEDSLEIRDQALEENRNVTGRG